MADLQQLATLVLCLFRYEAKSEGRIAWYRDSIMIAVDKPSQIVSEFERVITERRRIGWATGPYPKRWELTGYLTERPFPILH